MQTKNLASGHTIVYYNDLDEFPAERRSWLMRYQIEASEIPTTTAGLADKVSSIMNAYREGRSQDGEISLQNLFIALQSANQFYAPDHLSFGVLLHQVDGVLVTDLSPDGLSPLLATIAATEQEFTQITADVKKNSTTPETAIFLGMPELTL